MLFKSLRVLLFLLLLSTSHVFADPVPFKYPTLAPTDFQKELILNSDSVAVILGAGPSGLMAAFELKKTKKFKYIVIVEDRENYTRTNTVTFRPESIPKLLELGVFQALIPTFIFSQDFRFFLNLPSGPNLTSETFPGNLSEVLYSESDLSKVFQGAGWPHYAIKISDFEGALANAIGPLENVFLIQGRVKEASPSLTRLGRHSVRIETLTNKKPTDIIFDGPKMILIAEGARSSTRGLFGIQFEPIPDSEIEYRCAGSVSMRDFFASESMINHISLAVETSNNTAVFGVFRERDYDLFLNGQMTRKEWDEWTAEDCLRESAYRLLNYEKDHLTFHMPKSSKDLKVTDSIAGKFTVELSRANAFHVGDNVFLFGDAAGNGSPKGGIGLSLVTSVYMELLRSLTERLFSAEAEGDGNRILSDYDQRAGQIVDFWHSNLKQ